MQKENVFYRFEWRKNIKYNEKINIQQNILKV